MTVALCWEIQNFLVTEYFLVNIFTNSGVNHGCSYNPDPLCFFIQKIAGDSSIVCYIKISQNYVSLVTVSFNYLCLEPRIYDLSLS
jgi:hypothetical protein